MVPVGKELPTSKFILDAYEGSDLGDYMWMSRPNKRYWEVPPVMCNVKDRNGKDHFCDSEDSFKELVFKTYGLRE